METYFNTKELAGYLRAPEQTIRRWVMNNEIPYCRIHGIIRYRLSEIEKWIEEHNEKVPATLNKKQQSELFNETETAEAVDDGRDGETTDSGVVNHD